MTPWHIHWQHGQTGEEPKQGGLTTFTMWVDCLDEQTWEFFFLPLQRNIGLLCLTCCMNHFGGRDFLNGALSGLRVLDVTQVMAGPFCATMLADMGADVIKIEPPAGDTSRKFKGAVGADSMAFNAVNRGKRGMVFNFKDPEARALFRKLVATADILIENYRPGVMKSFGLDYETISQEYPSLIYCSISGYGQTGPYAMKGGFDLVAQGMSGVMSVTGEPGGPPVKCGIPVTDLGAGLFAVVGILGALNHRHRTGEGQQIDTSLLEAGIGLSVWEATEYFTDGAIPQRLGSAHRLNAPYQAVRCSDGYVNVGGANEKNFQLFCAICGHPEWASLPEFANNTLRVKNRSALIEQIENVTINMTRAELLAKMDAAGVPGGSILDYAEVFQDPHVLAREMVQEVEHPTLGKLRALGSPIKFSKTPVNVKRVAPLMGQHTLEVLEGLGISADEIARLRSSGAIG
jgi:crotonobetainyl-CoA:carnitine CoA-transferase CaiB-like acyl-CoA transferase